VAWEQGALKVFKWLLGGRKKVALSRRWSKVFLGSSRVPPRDRSVCRAGVVVRQEIANLPRNERGA